MRACQNHENPSIRAAYDVDRRSLSRRLEGGFSRALVREPQQLMLKRWILDREAQGHPPTFPEVRALATVISGEPNDPA